jgi:hypothetical protein
VKVAGMDEGTSIGIGYFAESYIDFGRWIMFMPVFLLGLFCGLVYRFFVRGCREKAIGMAVASTILIFGGISVEQSSTKIIGGNVTSLLCLGLATLLFARFFWAAVCPPETKRRRKRVANVPPA